MKIINEEEIALSKHSSRDDKKKSYSEPTLKEIGGVNDLTKGPLTLGDTDGDGTFHNPSL